MFQRWVAAVYQIRCNVTGDIYIGGSQNVYQRWYTHRCQLRNGTHPVKPMLAAWIAFGEEAFEFSILEIINKDEFGSTYGVFHQEKRWIMRMNPQYNRMK